MPSKEVLFRASLTVQHPQRKRRQRVLLCEQDRALRQLLMAILTEDELDADEISRNAELFAYLRQHSCTSNRRNEPPDLVITDLHLPGWTALELLRAFEAALPNTPIIFISASAEDMRAARGHEKTSFALLPKPFDPDDLRLCIRGLLANDPLHSELNS